MKKKTLIKRICLIFCALFTGALNGLFGGGGGMLAVPILEKGYKENVKTAHATAVLIMLPITIVSSIVYMIKIKTEATIFWEIFCSVSSGGIMGAFLLKWIPSKIVAFVFSLLAIASGIKMGFF